MSNKPTLSFYTNIPTPYQLSFFNELSKLFALTVIYYSVTENNREWDLNLNSGYKVVVLKNNFIARVVQKKVIDFHFSWQIFKIAITDKSQYVIVGGSYWIPNAAFAMFISRIRSKKVAYFTEPLFAVRGKIKYAIKWLMLRIVAINCDAIFCIGKKAAKSFEALGVRTPKFIVPYNIDSKGFADTDANKLRQFIERYKSQNEFIILSSGSLIERKGMDILIRAVKQVQNPNIKLIIIGDGPQKNELVKLQNGDNRIVFAGFQKPDDIPYFFALADVFAFASRYDGWAVVINEAIAANVPVISSDQVGASVELITTDKQGLLCRSDDVESFSNAIRSLADNVAKLNEMKEASKELIPLISSDHYANYVYDIFVNERV